MRRIVRPRHQVPPAVTTAAAATSSTTHTVVTAGHGFRLLLLHQAVHPLVPRAALGSALGDVLADGGDLGLELVERRLAAAGPLAQGGQERGHGARGQVAQGRDAGDLDLLAGRVELGLDEARVHGRHDRVLELPRGGEAELLDQGGVGQGGVVAGVGEDGELPELEGLGLVEGRQALRRGVVCVRAVAEDAEEGEVRGEVGLGGEGLDLGRLEELCEEKGVWV